MAIVNITSQGVSVGLKSNKLYVSDRKDIIKEIPINRIDRLNVFEGVKISSNLIEFAIENKIDINFMKSAGKYVGRISGGEKDCAELVRKQIKLTGNEEFRINLAKKLIKSKINNQIVLLNRKNKDDIITENLTQMKNMKKKLDFCEDVTEIMGYEGFASREYFDGISKIINEEFSFKGRSRRPPRDMFNAMLSMSYSLLFSEIMTITSSKGLYFYAGFMHSDKKGHPSLISDFMEEWRPVICDSTVISIINKKWITRDAFNFNDDGSVYLNNKGLKILIEQMSKKFSSEILYFDKKMSYREALERQVDSFIEVLKNEDLSLYKISNIR